MGLTRSLLAFMLLPMTITTSLDGRAHARASYVRRPAPATTPFVSLRLADGGAPHGALSGAVRHAIEEHGSLTPSQRLALIAPSDLPRLYTPAEAALLIDALATAGATVTVVAKHTF